MLTRKDLCPGFIEGTHGAMGVCCCKLFWLIEQPPHLRNGMELSERQYQRLLQREADAMAAENRRADLIAEDQEHRPAMLKRTGTR